MITHFDSEVSLDDLRKQMGSNIEKLCLVDFYADWCEPCKWLSELLDLIFPDISSMCGIIKIDIDKSPELKSHFKIRSVPVLILFKNGEEVWRINGFLSAPDLKNKIKSFL